MCMLHHIVLILGNHFLIQRFLKPMEGAPSNIYYTKKMFCNIAPVVKIIEKKTCKGVNSL